MADLQSKVFWIDQQKVNQNRMRQGLRIPRCHPSVEPKLAKAIRDKVQALKAKILAWRKCDTNGKSSSYEANAAFRGGAVSSGTTGGIATLSCIQLLGLVLLSKTE